MLVAHGNSLTLVLMQTVRPWVSPRTASGPSLGLPEASRSPRGIPRTAGNARGLLEGAGPDLGRKVEPWRPGPCRALGPACCCSESRPGHTLSSLTIDVTPAVRPFHGPPRPRLPLYCSISLTCSLLSHAGRDRWSLRSRAKIRVRVSATIRLITRQFDPTATG